MREMLAMVSCLALHDEQRLTPQEHDCDGSISSFAYTESECSLVNCAMSMS